MHLHITASGSTNIDKAGGSAVIRFLEIQVNAALTGTITVADVNGTIAVITNPTVGSSYKYRDLQGQATVNPSATCDITVCWGDRLD